MRAIFRLFFFLLIGSLITSCATVFGSRNNTLVFRSDSGQTAEVFLDGEKIGDAPGKIKVPARQIQDGSLLEIRAAGMEPQTITLSRELNKAYFWIDMFSSLGIGAGIDMGTGYLYRPVPRKLDYPLTND